jgi:hypothetical protein
MNNEVRDGFGRLIGFRCWQCDEIKTKMWGEICNACRAQTECPQCKSKRIKKSADGWSMDDGTVFPRQPSPMTLTHETARELVEAGKQAADALASCYQVCDYPANGKTVQDMALALIRAAIERAEKEMGGK